jgi:hypothetical protein
MQYSKCQASSSVKTRLYEYIIKQSARGLCFWFCEYLEMIRYQGSKKFQNLNIYYTSILLNLVKGGR